MAECQSAIMDNETAMEMLALRRASVDEVDFSFPERMRAAEAKMRQCEREKGHEPPHRHGSEEWTDSDEEIGW